MPVSVTKDSVPCYAGAGAGVVQRGVPICAAATSGGGITISPLPSALLLVAFCKEVARERQVTATARSGRRLRRLRLEASVRERERERESGGYGWRTGVTGWGLRN